MPQPTDGSRSRTLLKGLSALGVVLVIAFVVLSMRANRRASTPGELLANQRIPSLEGLDPANAERDLQRFYRALVKFRAVKGRLPNTPWELRDAGRAGLVDLNDDDFRNPDAVKSPTAPLKVRGKDPAKVDLNVAYGFDFAGGSKSPIWMGCSLYEREGIESDDRGHGRVVSEGFTMLLYDDGRIVRRPVAERKWVRVSLNEYRPLGATESPTGKQILTGREVQETFLAHARSDAERSREKAGG